MAVPWRNTRHTVVSATASNVVTQTSSASASATWAAVNPGAKRGCGHSFGGEFCAGVASV